LCLFNTPSAPNMEDLIANRRWPETQQPPPSFRIGEASSLFPRTSPPEDVLCGSSIAQETKIVKRKVDRPSYQGARLSRTLSCYCLNVEERPIDLMPESGGIHEGRGWKTKYRASWKGTWMAIVVRSSKPPVLSQQCEPGMMVQYPFHGEWSRTDRDRNRKVQHLHCARDAHRRPDFQYTNWIGMRA
jgi:hypothetical protein